MVVVGAEMISRRLYEFFTLNDSVRWRYFGWALLSGVTLGTTATAAGIPRSISIPLVEIAAVAVLLLPVHFQQPNAVANRQCVSTKVEDEEERIRRGDTEREDSWLQTKRSHSLGRI